MPPRIWSPRCTAGASPRQRRSSTRRWPASISWRAGSTRSRPHGELPPDAGDDGARHASERLRALLSPAGARPRRPETRCPTGRARLHRARTADIGAQARDRPTLHAVVLSAACRVLLRRRRSAATAAPDSRTCWRCASKAPDGPLAELDPFCLPAALPCDRRRRRAISWRPSSGRSPIRCGSSLVAGRAPCVRRRRTASAASRAIVARGHRRAMRDAARRRASPTAWPGASARRRAPPPMRCAMPGAISSPRRSPQARRGRARKPDAPTAARGARTRA